MKHIGPTLRASHVAANSNEDDFSSETKCHRTSSVNHYRFTNGHFDCASGPKAWSPGTVAISSK
jgi:hypothetical protein